MRSEQSRLTRIILPMGANRIYKAITDGCALIGDAAHITSPAAGHGMNLVINDKSSEASNRRRFTRRALVGGEKRKLRRRL